MNNRYQQAFQRLKDKQQGAFVPFVMLGDPDLNLSYRILIQLIESGADALELGIPFSDPIADGPVIQKAAIRALSAGATVARCFELIASIRRDYPAIPMGLLVYSNLVVARGIPNFYHQAKLAGVDSVLVADVPTIEAGPFIINATLHDIAPIFIATPNADEATLQKVASSGQGYTYLLSRAGVTGTESRAQMPVQRVIERLDRFNAPPSLLGFGISEPQQVREAITAGAFGAISGSAVVKIVEEHQAAPGRLLQEIGEFVSKMKAATYNNQ